LRVVADVPLRPQFFFTMGRWVRVTQMGRYRVTQMGRYRVTQMGRWVSHKWARRL
jgi:hypothetical protein